LHDNVTKLFLLAQFLDQSHQRLLPAQVRAHRRRTFHPLDIVLAGEVAQ
jgi:hypothetical protein